MLVVASVPPVYVTSQLGEGILFVFALGKLGCGEVFSSLIKGDRLSFSCHLKCRHEATHYWVACSNFFDSRHQDACIYLWQLTGDLLFYMVPSIQVAHLLVYCVLISSLAELYLAFAWGMCWHVADGWSYHWQGDIINGYGLGFKVHCDT